MGPGICAAKQQRMIDRNRTKTGLAALIAVLPFIVAGAARNHDPTPGSSPDPMPAADTITRVEMQNVDFFVDPKISLHIVHLTGSMQSRKPGPIVFDDRNSFVFNVSSAQVGMDASDLAALMNGYVFNYRGAPLSHLRIAIENGEIVQRGTLRKVAALPFEIHAQVSATADGRIRIHPTRTEILGLHVDKLMHGLGLPLDKVINLRGARGATIQGNDIYLEPQTILPPPKINGRLSSATLEGDRVVMRFGQTSESAPMKIPLNDARNFMYYRGGTLRFGKLVMLDADMLITDLDPVDPFKFDLGHYQPQLVAGYSRTLASGGLVVWMRDIDRVTPALRADNSAGSGTPLRGTALAR
jgi:hypothetical protein